ncbi:TonB-dependent receptor domain-containing protein [Colwellia sp. 20A7]|uniref:TonB-dependent receptor domain-containing protein n=1 Tax=Colwellia sp. 20A7 TaxID=2689569 RepID=UPI0013591C47|nr:TonB-dependent receptor [Colwellia sp. 20A7]
MKAKTLFKKIQFKKTQLKKAQFKKTLTQIAVTSVLFSAASSSVANTVTEKSADIENIVVTANRTQQEQFLSLSATVVIGRAEIEAIQPQNVTELLNTVAGVTVANLGGAGQSSSVFMRGTNSNHTLVLVDGVRIGSATTGSTSFSSMSVALIERIEVVKGPRGALWGSDAIGGVIQIFTKKLNSKEGFVTAGIGSNGYWKTEAAIGLGDEDNSLTIAAALEESDGFNATEHAGQEDDDGYDRQSFSVNGQSKLSKEYTLDLVSHYEKGGSDYDSKSAGSDENEYENYSVKLGGAYNADKLAIETSFAKSQDQGGSFKSNTTPKVVSEITTKRDQFGLFAQYQLNDKTNLTGGFDWYKERVSNTSSDYEVNARKASAVFVQARHHEGQFLFEGAVRQDDIDGLDKEVTYNLSAGYQFNDDWLLSLSKGTGFKAPTFNDLYWPGSGNPLLKPEKVESSEILVRNQFNNGSVELSFYDTEIENLIAWAPNADGDWQPANVDLATAKGVDLTVSLQTGELSHLVAAAYVEAENKLTGKALLRRPKVTVTYTLGYQIGDFTTNIVFDFRGRSEDNKNTVTLQSELLTNISVGYQVSEDFSIVGKVNNLFDEEYRVAEDYLTDGVNFQLTGTYTF